MTGYVKNIEEETLKNSNFRQVLFTAPNSQLVLMCLKAGEDIGLETHDNDQFFRIEQGRGKMLVGDKEYKVGADWAVVVPAGTKHNLTNTGDKELKLYTIYSPPHHPDGTVHATKQEAMKAEKAEP